MIEKSSKIIRGGEYSKRGNYHKYLDPMWSYYPTYLAKTNFVKGFLDNLNISMRILDAGCGEGVLVEEYFEKGYNIWGLDLNYGSARIVPGDVTSMPFSSEIFDVILLLDVIEHLNFADQRKALKEVRRVLKAGGRIIASIPNLAHLNSRIKFLLKGELARTAKIDKHPGDRPIREYLSMLRENGFEIIYRKGLTLTVPILTTKIIWRDPKRFLWLYNVLDKFAYPDLSFVNLIIARKG
ncbi:MAG: class I SAM-dependent methyltransferase [Candidatus Ranarchaeia archaeon]